VNEFMLLLSRVPAEAFPVMGRLLTALLAGDTDKAEREARIAAETIAAKRAIHEAYEAGKRQAGTGE
jgi:hypothetical protein